MIPKLSSAGKMPCKSFSLPVNDEVCKGRYNDEGDLKAVCQQCYAAKGFYRMKPAIALREHNLACSKQDNFRFELLEVIRKEIKGKYFRWFDSGDIYSDKFLKDIIHICSSTPDIFHWIPTKTRHLFNQNLWEALENLPNVKVRYSADGIEGEYNKNLHGSTVYQDKRKLNKKEVFTCKAPRQNGKCENCRACWHNKKVIAYKLH